MTMFSQDTSGNAIREFYLLGVGNGEEADMAGGGGQSSRVHKMPACSRTRACQCEIRKAKHFRPVIIVHYSKQRWLASSFYLRVSPFGRPCPLPFAIPMDTISITILLITMPPRCPWTPSLEGQTRSRCASWPLEPLSPGG
jgi:hypothetical protein